MINNVTNTYHQIAFKVPKIGVDHLRPSGETPVLCCALKYMPARQDRKKNIRNPSEIGTIMS